MQVYVVEPAPGDVHAFRNFGDIKPSLEISYSACKNVIIEMTPKATGGPVFTITGYRGDVPFSEELLVTRLPVWDSPTHI